MTTSKMTMTATPSTSCGQWLTRVLTRWKVECWGIVATDDTDRTLPSRAL